MDYPTWLSLEALEPDPNPENTVPPALPHALERIQSNGLPDWLSANAPDPKPSLAARQMLHMTFESLFQYILDRLALGHMLETILLDDQRERVAQQAHQIDQSQLMRWITRDPERLSQMHEHMGIGAEFLMSQTIPIADATDNELEDVRRSDVRIAARQKLAASYARKRFAPAATIDATIGISITRALADANDRLRDYRPEPLEVVSTQRGRPSLERDEQD